MISSCATHGLAPDLHDQIRHIAFEAVYGLFADVSNPLNRGPKFTWTESFGRVALQDATAKLQDWAGSSLRLIDPEHIEKVLQREVHRCVQQCLQRAGLVVGL